MAGKLIHITDWNERARLAGYDPAKLAASCRVSLRRRDDLEPLAIEAGFRVNALAACLGISRRQLARLFREWFHACPRECLRQFRFQRALLKAREHVPVKVIALELGYHHCSDFIRAFKHLTGTTPGKVWRGSPNNRLPKEEVCGMSQNAYRKMLSSRAP